LDHCPRVKKAADLRWPTKTGVSAKKGRPAARRSDTLRFLQKGRWTEEVLQNAVDFITQDEPHLRGVGK
jgi:hypothetical protein